MAHTIAVNAVQSFMADAANTLFNLAERWRDEKEYEDIDAYRAVIEPIVLRHNARIISMTKRPFGVRIVFPQYSPYGYHVAVRIHGGKMTLGATSIA